MASLENAASGDVAKVPQPSVRPNANVVPGRGLSIGSKSNPATDGDEQALESHEVIELQSFSERKVWIEEKIKFLESLPPIEVFIGIEEISNSAEEIPGLPTRAQLEQWVLEHDAIEKETEIFDTGELKKLRKLTKAATQRNLSPEDTDVIELTLTTIYALDKLLHLLRDRSENLEMMNTRLVWEEYRSGSWKDRRQLIEDVRTFAATRAQWNPSVYEALPSNTEGHGLIRRGSIASIASTKSENPITSPAFSRAARYKLGEQLSRDAALLSGRIGSMKHGKVALAGKALDKLIDQSRRGPVPDAFLDEMDRLEEMAEKEMEGISQYLVKLVMQWRRADEIYVETLKDQTSASNLLEEIETAKMHHPTARQSASFNSRVDTILKRLTLRGNPAFHGSIFPRPEHPLFPDQSSFNAKLTQDLSNDIAAALKTAQAAEIAAREYRQSYEVVKATETWLESVDQSIAALTVVSQKIREGVPDEDGKGLPPDLMQPACLDPTSHSLYIALFPTLVQDCKDALAKADVQLELGPSRIIQLEAPNIDSEFKATANAKVQELTLLRSQTSRLLEDVLKKTGRLRDSRKISANIDSTLAKLRDAKVQIAETMDKVKWRQEFNNTSVPLTPESPAAEIFSPIPTQEQLSQIETHIDVNITIPLSTLSSALEAPLQAYLSQKVISLQSSLKDGYQLFELLGAIKHQASCISSARDDFHSLLSRIEDAKIQLNDIIEHTLRGSSSTHIPRHGFPGDPEPPSLDTLQKDATSFIEGLSGRIPFVARRSSSLAVTQPLKSPPLSGNFDAAFITASQGIPLPFDLASLDSAVRSDSNSYAMRINGGLRSLEGLQSHLEASRMAKSADIDMDAILSDANAIVQDLSKERTALTTTSRHAADSGTEFATILERLKKIHDRHASSKRSLSPTRKFLRQMNERLQTVDAGIREHLYKSRTTRLDDIESRLNDIGDTISTLINDATRAVELERKYEDDMRLAKERRMKEEAARLAAEEAERLRLEDEERRAAEERLKEEAKLKEDRRQALEREHHAAYLAERARLEEEAAATERQRLLEIEQEAIAAQARADEQRRLEEEAEKLRLEKERLDALEQLRLAKEQLDEQRRLFAQQELATSEHARLYQRQLDELSRRQAEIQQQAEANARRAESERIAKEQAEKDAKGREQELSEQQSELQKLLEAGRLRAERDVAEMAHATLEAEKRAQELEQQRLRALQLAEQRARETEIARAKAERAEQEAKDLAAELEKQKLALEEEKQRLALEEEKQRLAKQQAEAALQAKAEKHSSHKTSYSLPESVYEDSDVFGIQAKPGHRKSQSSHDRSPLQSKVLALRKRLRSISIAETLHPTKSSTSLPNATQLSRMRQEFSEVASQIEKLPETSEDANLSVELKSLRDEVESSARLLEEIQPLVSLSGAIHTCDGALSDLLEHIDSFPMVPYVLSTTYTTPGSATPEEQLSTRLSHTKGLVEDAAAKLAVVSEDSRAASEYSRIWQTWEELHEMANDKISPHKSRPASAISRNSSGQDSSISVNPPLPPIQSSNSRKKASYSGLSVSSLQSKGKLLAPPAPNVKSRRSVSSSKEPPSRSESRVSSVSATSNRSVSGPMTNSRLFGSTFASRQRTTSLSSTSTVMGPPVLQPRRPSQAPSRLRLDSQTKRGVSPAMSENSHSSMGPSRSTWSRAPRDSLASKIPRVVTPHKKPAPPVRKKYIADPKNKLDVAVGEVVNQLPVGINVEGITETWKDQSGKYWIGNQDPKLCFCRILRSQTVMVRVGGGWTELSRFIKDHFAESFRVAPESPPRPGSRSEKWISSASLLQARENLSPPPHPRTPEPTGPFIPSFALVTPSGHSPKSILSTSPPSNVGSPLTPLQFIRRAEAEHAQMRPASPSAKMPARSRPSLSNTPARPSVWRP